MAKDAERLTGWDLTMRSARSLSITLTRAAVMLGIGVLFLGFAATGALADEAVSSDIRPRAPDHQCDLLTHKAYSDSWEDEQEALKHLDLTTARAVCREAVNDYPAESRFKYQLAWVIADSDFDEAVRLGTTAAKKGYAPAQRRIGEFILFGLGLEKDTKEGLRLLREAAEQGFAPASSMLADVYILGLAGVEVDEAKSARWAQAAAVKGHADAQYLYGQLLRQGIGVPENKPEALQWFLKAQAQGNRDAADMAKFLTDGLRAPDGR